jgi:hypothetical protein
MLGYIHVFDHPFFAITDHQGAFSISNVPPGTYTLKAWHEDAGVRTEEITVGNCPTFESISSSATNNRKYPYPSTQTNLYESSVEHRCNCSRDLSIYNQPLAF